MDQEEEEEQQERQQRRHWVVRRQFEPIEHRVHSNDDLESFLTSSTSSESSSNSVMEAAISAESYTSYQCNKPMYVFQPLILTKVQYKSKHRTGFYPAGRSGHRITATESQLFSLGGYNPSRASVGARRGMCQLFQELWAYNFAANKWKLLLNGETAPTMPRELASNALAMYKDVIISYGGTGFPFGESCSNDCYIYTTNGTPQVTRLEVSGDLPIAQYGSGIVIHEQYLYTIGGTTGYNYSCDVYRLNLVTMVWEGVYMCQPELRDDPEGRYRHEVAYDGHHIFVLGGGTSNSVFGLQKLPAFNLKTHSWDYFETWSDQTAAAETPNDQDAGFPKPRKCFSCVQHTNDNGDVEAFITGGLEDDFAKYYTDIWRLNLRSKQWTWIRTSHLPKPLYFHSAAHSGNGCMYIFGGVVYNPSSTRRRNELYRVWMTVPKLSEMCWDAVTYYIDNIESYDRTALLAAGIPERFVGRVQLRPLGSDGNATVSRDKARSANAELFSKRQRTR